jgi:hypothetical protein
MNLIHCTQYDESEELDDDKTQMTLDSTDSQDDSNSLHRRSEKTFVLCLWVLFFFAARDDEGRFPGATSKISLAMMMNPKLEANSFDDTILSMMLHK